MRNPPTLAVGLLRRLLSDRDRNIILGDLLEEFQDRGAEADRWYLRQVVGFLTLARLTRLIPPRVAFAVAAGLAEYAIFWGSAGSFAGGATRVGTLQHCLRLAVYLFCSSGRAARIGRCPSSEVCRHDRCFLVFAVRRYRGMGLSPTRVQSFPRGSGVSRLRIWRVSSGRCNARTGRIGGVRRGDNGTTGRRACGGDP